jgi:hypothetical protein
MSDNGALILGAVLFGGIFVGAAVQEEHERRQYEKTWRSLPSQTLTREQADLKKVREMAWNVEDAIRRGRHR